MVFSFRQLPNVDAAGGRRLRLGDPDRQSRIFYKPSEPKRQGLKFRNNQGEESRAYNTLPVECSGGL